jgi:hypothetical protein
MKKCIYCKADLNEESLIDFCERCGREVFGDKMFNVIVRNMTEASKRGDLEQGKW